MNNIYIQTKGQYNSYVTRKIFQHRLCYGRIRVMQTAEGKSPDIPAHPDTPRPETVQEKKVNDALKVCQAHTNKK